MKNHQGRESWKLPVVERDKKLSPEQQAVRGRLCQDARPEAAPAGSGKSCPFVRGAPGSKTSCVLFTPSLTPAGFFPLLRTWLSSSVPRLGWWIQERAQPPPRFPSASSCYTPLTCPFFYPPPPTPAPGPPSSLLSKTSWEVSSVDLTLEFLCLKPSSLLDCFPRSLGLALFFPEDKLSSGYWCPLLPPKERSTLLPAEGFTLGQAAVFRCPQALPWPLAVFCHLSLWFQRKGGPGGGQESQVLGGGGTRVWF